MKQNKIPFDRKAMLQAIRDIKKEGNKYITKTIEKDLLNSNKLN